VKYDGAPLGADAPEISRIPSGASTIHVVNYIDRHATLPMSRSRRRRITRGDARRAFALEMLPLPVFGAFYGVALAIGDGAAAGFFAAIGLVGLLASGLGWLYLREPAAALKVFVARMLFIVLAAVAVIDTSFTELGVMLAAGAFFFAVSTPALSAGVLALKWWPRTSGYV